MQDNVQKWFTGLGLTGTDRAMSMTRNSIFLPSLATAATFAVAAALALAAPVAATGLAATAPMSAEAARLDGLVDRAWAAPDTSSPHRLAQYSPVPPRGRPVSDHDHARQTARAGENRGFDELMRSAQSRGRGEYLGVEPDIGRNVYRFKFLRSGGNVVWVDVDGRTGRVIAERD
jgi:hypothetical protein